VARETDDTICRSTIKAQGHQTTLGLNTKCANNINMRRTAEWLYIVSYLYCKTGEVIVSSTLLSITINPW